MIIVDGRNTLFRASYANARLGYQGPDGWQPTGGVYGFFESILSVAHRAKDAEIVIAWEGSKAHRRDVVDTYKVRKSDEKKEELVRLVLKQEAIVKEMLQHTGWMSIRCPDWEADDAIGVMAMAAAKVGSNVAILSNDADMLQLLREPTKQGCEFCGGTLLEEFGESGEFWLDCIACGKETGHAKRSAWIRQIKPSKGLNVVWSSKTLEEEWGVPPELVTTVKALSGDSSDCYGGCPGIGDSWARKIVAAAGSMPWVFHAAEIGEAGSRKKSEDILANREYIEACLTVARIQLFAKLELTEHAPNKRKLLAHIDELRFHTLRTSRNIRRMLK